MCVWLANLQPETQKPSLELFRKPRTHSKTAGKECDLFPNDQELSSKNSKHTNRIGDQALAKVVPNRVNNGLNRGFEEPRNFCAVWAKCWVLTC